jgi:hypothetical protein
MGDKKLWEEFGDKRPVISTALKDLKTTETLTVPFRSQSVRKREWIGNICSPVSVCMAIEHFGKRQSTEEIAGAVYDPQVKMFGIWTRAVQVAAQHGIRGYVRRFRNWDEVRTHVKQGAVICCSIRFKRNEVTDPPIIYRKRGTTGHIIVIKGFLPGGRVITNDSASRRYGRNLVWRLDDLARAWFDKGGVAYVFTGMAGNCP